ncbi:efflux RND transporter periplasmic adaptor subunit [Daejeonella sp. H1SJ63]|uniref:efflux RND transporter periplasmic adaptor subunit n=1 Tax=Daejeonella sp. H1SJ63 TaxID=3034145 RepID=UPI0023ECB584|nr:efflux RND transporter periplasmic adaptor subunit [Daejeonella sp. H1SJ63]
MKKILKGSIVLFLVLGFILAGCNSNEKSEQVSVKYTCPMHPEILKDGPGTCPICKMDLVPLDHHDGHAAADESLNALVRPANEYIISGIRTVRPEKGFKSTELSMKGIINYNTNNWRSLSARVSGRIERLYVKYNYQMVSKGQKIMDIYSPDLANAQQELLFLKSNADAGLLESAKKKLLYLGMNSAQIDQVLNTGKISYTISVYSPYSGYVAELNLNAGSNQGSSNAAGATRISSSGSSGMNSMSSGSSADAVPEIPVINTGQAFQLREGQYVSAGQNLFNLINANQVWAEFYVNPELLDEFKPGSKIDVSALDIPDQKSESSVSLIQPYYNEGQNYSLVKANLMNENKKWKVGQLITVKREARAEGFWLPRTALLRLGEKYAVFVKKGDAFVPVYVTLKRHTDKWVDVGTSIAEDQELALNAWFLVDSESFIKAERL